MGMGEGAGAGAPARGGRGIVSGALVLASGGAIGAVVGFAVLLLSAGIGRAHDDAGIMTFLREEAARRLPAMAAPAPRPVAATAPRREPAPRTGATAPPARMASFAPVSGPASATGRTACVRLCDGYFFPLGPLSSPADRPRHQAACEAACPHAPVALFTLAPGASDMASARGPDGVLYRALPQAFAHRTRRVAGCSCQGPDNVARRLDPAADPTLRRGDVIVGQGGARAFAGRGGAFEDFRRSGALSPTARRQVDALLAVTARETQREAFLRTMTVVRLEPARTAAAGFAPVPRAAPGFAPVRSAAGAAFTAVN